MVTRKRDRVKAVVVARKGRGVVEGLNISKYSADIAEKEGMKLLNLFDLRKKVKREEKKDGRKKDNLFKEENNSIEHTDKDEGTDDAEPTGYFEVISSDLTPEHSELEDRDFSEIISGFQDFEVARKKHSNRKEEDEKNNHENKEKLLDKVGKKTRTRPLSARLLELAEPKPLPSEVIKDMKYEPFTIRKAALKYRASRRIKQLAQPVVRGNVQKKDVFKVKRSSLRAICSERIKKLAEAKRAKSPEPNLFQRFASAFSVNPGFYKRVEVRETPTNKSVIRKRTPPSQSNNSLTSKRTKRHVKMRKGQVVGKIKKQPDLETDSSSQSDDEKLEANQESCIDVSTALEKVSNKVNLSESTKHANKINQKHFKKVTKLSKRIKELSMPKSNKNMKDI